MITQQELQEVIKYEPLTGVFTWIKSRGFIARGTKCKGVHITYKNVRYDKNRLAWLYMEGVYPMKMLFSVDGDNSNLKWDNIHTVSKNHTDIGCIVSNSTYHIFIIQNGETVDLGTHDNYDDAFDVARQCLK